MAEPIEGVRPLRVTGSAAQYTCMERGCLRKVRQRFCHRPSTSAHRHSQRAQLLLCFSPPLDTRLLLSLDVFSLFHIISVSYVGITFVTARLELTLLFRLLPGHFHE